MSNKLKIVLTLCVLLSAPSIIVRAADVEFRGSAPSQVVVGKPFQLTYFINVRGKDFQAPEFEHFDHLAGPYTSQSSSTSFVNGKMTSSFQQTYTFTLMASEEGTFTIPPATIRANGDRIQSNGVRITVLPPDESAQVSQQQQQQASRPSSPTTSTSSDASVSKENIFIRTIVSKTKVHEQEALLLSYKLYFAGVDVAQFTNNTKIPDFTGFLKQEIEQKDIQTELEHYNGRNYQTAVLYQTLLYPQHSGDIKIEPAAFEAVLRVQTRGQVRSIFDDFFGSYTNVTKALAAPGVTIHVEALPTPKPRNFSGAVGSFNLNQSISSQELTANEAVTLHFDITGTGNMKLIKTPAVDWPDGFEVYDPKVTNKFKTTTNGVSGTKSIEYLAIPRAAGDYTIPAVTFSYFDTQSDSYKTLSTPEYHLHVARAAGQADNSAASSTASHYSGVQKENVRSFGSDIRYIYNGPVDMSSAPRQSITLSRYGLLMLITLGIGLILFVIFYRRIKENADITRVRYKKANKVAQKRLKSASALLKANKTSEFYAEIERAAFSYLSDRLSIPTSDLSIDNIATLLREKNVPESLVTEVNDVLSTAQFARYAPSTSADAQALYDRTVSLINNLESQRI